LNQKTNFKFHKNSRIHWPTVCIDSAYYI